MQKLHFCLQSSLSTTTLVKYQLYFAAPNLNRCNDTKEGFKRGPLLFRFRQFRKSWVQYE